MRATVIQSDQQKDAAVAEGADVIVHSVDVYDVSVCVGGGGGRCQHTLR